MNERRMILMNSFISRIGGKKLLRGEILRRFPETPFDRYVEPFGGAGWVLFASPQHAKLEVYNDIDSDLVNLFRCVKFHCAELQRQVELVLQLHSREVFDDIKSQFACRGFTDIQRAAQYFMLIRESYGSDIRTYGGRAGNLITPREYLSEVSLRLQRVKIEHKDFAALIKSYDAPATLFYLDPPYHGTEKYYSSSFTEQDHVRLKECLKALQGRFILSYNDDVFVRELYSDFEVEPITRQNNLAMRYPMQDKEYHELIIRNYR